MGGGGAYLIDNLGAPKAFDELFRRGYGEILLVRPIVHHHGAL